MSVANKPAWILSHIISGTSDSEGYWYYPQHPILFMFSINVGSKFIQPQDNRNVRRHRRVSLGRILVQLLRMTFTKIYLTCQRHVADSMHAGMFMLFN